MRSEPSQPNFFERAPAAFKLALTLLLILSLGALPAPRALWGLWALPVLFAIALAARVPLRRLLRGLLMACPFLFSLGLFSLFRQPGAPPFWALLVKSSVSVLAVQLLANTTPLSDLLACLRRVHVPEVLCTTIALLQRYSALLAEESTRMARARAGRTLRVGRINEWRARANSIGLLFMRSVSRAERVQAAMRARGGA